MKKKIAVGLILCLFVVSGLYLYDSRHAVDFVQCEPMDISFAAETAELSPEAYRLLFLQTGLGQTAIEDLRRQSDSDGDFLAMLQKFQAQLQNKRRYRRRFLFFPTTTEEALQNGDGSDCELELPPLRAGDILITKSTKTLLYRHGHAALVLNPTAGTVVEAMMLGTTSDICSVDGWLSYPTVLVLRPKNAAQQTIDAAVSFGKTRLVGVPYRLLTGLLQKDKSEQKAIRGTQCAHLVWQAYYAAGLSLDSDGGWLVTPHDLADSDALEIVFSFGFGENGRW